MKFELKSAKAIEIGAVGMVGRDFAPGTSLPLVIRPKVPGLDLASWLAREKTNVEADLLKYGAILFRGFEIDRLELFEKVVKSYDPALLAYNERSTPRTAVGANVYTATEYPADKFIPLHNENAYSHQFPLKLWFGCLIASETGGETPLADNRRVTETLRPEIIELFKRKKVMYVRNFSTGLDLDWKTAFQTESAAEVEAYCRRAGIEFEWRNGGGLRTRQIRPATIVHPADGAELWFNQAHLFHVSGLDEDVRRDLLETTAADALPRNALFGDGEEIPVSLLEEIRAAYDRCRTQFRWEKGDVLLVDNLAVCHARNPYTGARRVVVAMSELFRPGV